MKKILLATILAANVILLSSCTGVVQNDVSDQLEEISDRLDAIESAVGTSGETVETEETLPDQTTDAATNTTEEGSTVEGDSEYYGYYEYIPLTDAQIKSEFFLSDSNFIISITNLTENNYSSIEPMVIYYNEANEVLYSASGYFSGLNPGETNYTAINYPVTEFGEQITYDHYEVLYKGAIDNEPIDNHVEDVLYTANLDVNGNVILKVQNKAGVTLSSISTYVLYYVEDQLVGTAQGSCYDTPDGSYNIISFGMPYDKNYNELYFQTYEVVVTDAISYQ